MSRTHHRTSPDVARRRRALRTAMKEIEEAWTFRSWGGRTCRRIGREKALEFREHMRQLSGDWSRSDTAWWAAVKNIRPWMPRQWRRTSWAS
jgi:hypothetical protein